MADCPATSCRTGHRRQGVTAVGLGGTLDLITDLSAVSTYERAGFVRDRQIGKHRWIVSHVVAPRDSDD